MKRLKVTIAFAAIVLIMNSCVYSLFPIYTNETLVFLPELIGKWQTNSSGDYIEFEAANNDKKDVKATMSDVAFTMNDDTDGNPETYNYEITGDGWVARGDEPITVEVNGELIDDPVKVKAYYDSIFGGMESDTQKALGAMVNELDSAVNSEGNELGDMMRDLSKGLGKLGKALKEVDAKINGTSYVTKKESYFMTVMEDGLAKTYLAHVVEIGEDYFLDIYPMPELQDNILSDNLFPVHTFMKMNLENGQLKLTPFDLEKLNELFESNLVRLRHEYVEGNVVITAQPEEIQKFLDRYSNDETVFEEAEVYSKTAL